MGGAGAGPRRAAPQEERGGRCGGRKRFRVAVGGQHGACRACGALLRESRASGAVSPPCRWANTSGTATPSAPTSAASPQAGAAPAAAAAAAAFPASRRSCTTSPSAPWAAAPSARPPSTAAPR